MGNQKHRRKAGFRAEFIPLYLCGNRFARDCPLYAISTGYFNREGCWEKQHSQIPCRCWVAELEDSVEGVIPIDHLLDKANSKIRMQHLHCTQFYLKNCKYQYRHMIQQKVKHKFWEKKTPRQVQCMPWVHYPLALVKF
jgi:hypothetical protein